MDPRHKAKYQRIVEGVGQIPSLPVVVTKLLKVINHPNSSADDAAKFIEKDIGMAGKVLKLANSPYYGIPNTINTVNSAVVILGFNAIKSIVLSTSVVKMFPNRPGSTVFNRVAFWKHCVEVAIFSRFLSLRLPGRNVDPEIAFSAGLLHDIGTMVLDQTLPAEYMETIQAARRDAVPLEIKEAELMGVTHAEISGLLLEKWDIPEALRLPTAFHHEPANCPVDKPTAYLIALANSISHMRGSDYFPEQRHTEGLIAQAIAFLGMKETEEEIKVLCDQEADRAQDFFQLLQS